VADLSARRRLFARRTAVAAVCGLALVIGAAVRPAAVESAAAGPALYAAAQAASGGKTYTSSCAQCHGENLEGGVGPALRGPNLVRLAKKTKLTVGDFFQFLALQMPLNAPASLSHDQYAGVMAYILKRNGYPAGSKALTYAAAMSSPAIMTTYPGR
jgi:mono/diheme cytochrome c family protein